MEAPEPAPGQTWRSLGKAGHDRHVVRVVKLTRGGRVVVETAASPRRNKNRLRTMSLAVFLNNYTLEGVPHD